MNLLEIIFTGIGLSMDAFAVSICKGLSIKNAKFKNALIIALYFSIFHIIMPVIGYALGNAFELIVNKLDHWIAFILLVIIGINMIRESNQDEKENKNDKVDVKTMLLISIAISIDSLAVGITFAFLKVNLILAVSIIGLITFAISLIGFGVGNKFGDKINDKAKLIGGFILIIIGLKILLEHLGILVL